MAVGLRTGLVGGIVTGSRVGSGVDELGGGSNGGMAGVAQDATSSKYMPANAAQWTTTMAAAGIASGNPTTVLLMQEASGTLADSIGANSFAAFGTPAYQQAVSGWSAKAVGLVAQASCFFSTTIGATTTTSALVLCYARAASTPAAPKALINVGGSTADRHALITTGPFISVTGGGGQATGTGTSGMSTTVRPVVLQVNRAGSVLRIATDQDNILPTYTVPAGGTTYLSLGPDSVGDGGTEMDLLYTAVFVGAAAEVSQAQVKTLLQTLGWTVAWS